MKTNSIMHELDAMEELVINDPERFYPKLRANILKIVGKVKGKIRDRYNHDGTIQEMIEEL
jgi:hypothetical protein